MTRTLHYQITSSDAGSTILSFLKQHGYSHPVIVHLKKTPEGIIRNGHWAYVNETLQEGDTLTVTLCELPPKEKKDSHILPAALPLSIVYEDEDILLVNKPAGQSVHPSLGHYEDTLANAVAYHYREDVSFRFHCINRLDKNTSGLVLIARHMLSAAVLSVQVKNRQLHRTYLAVVKGETPLFGTVDAPIGRVNDSVIERCVDEANGKRAVTHYKRNGLFETDGCRYSLLSLTLETGRTHQIRVHMKHISHPLPGDFLYCPEYESFSRQPLHSASLSFLHPVTNEPLTFHAPLAPDIKNALMQMDCLSSAADFSGIE
jgi:23S rRNA pseudouridine1911/1915/1917 synthase